MKLTEHRAAFQKLALFKKIEGAPATIGAYMSLEGPFDFRISQLLLLDFYCRTFLVLFFLTSNVLFYLRRFSL